MRVAHMMTKDLVTVGLDDTLRHVQTLFEKHAFHHLVVLEEGRVFGVVSDRDLLRALSPRIGTISERPADTATLNRRVHQIMTRQPITLGPDADLFDALSLFEKHTISCLPIVDDEQLPLGILSWRDILGMLREQIEEYRRAQPTEEA